MKKQVAGKKVSYRAEVQNEVFDFEHFVKGDIVNVCWEFPSGSLEAFRAKPASPSYFGGFELKRID